MCVCTISPIGRHLAALQTKRGFVHGGTSGENIFPSLFRGLPPAAALNGPAAGAEFTATGWKPVSVLPRRVFTNRRGGTLDPPKIPHSNTSHVPARTKSDSPYPGTFIFRLRRPINIRPAPRYNPPGRKNTEAEKRVSTGELNGLQPLKRSCTPTAGRECRVVFLNLFLGNRLMDVFNIIASDCGGLIDAAAWLG